MGQTKDCDYMIDSLYNNLKGVLEMNWPILVVSILLLVSLRLTYLLKYNKKILIYKEIYLLFFAVYILCLFQVVTSQDINMLKGNNFVPFVEIFRYEIGGRLFVKNIVGNVVMFIPYGFFISKYISSKKMWINMFLIFLASISIECTQLIIGRVFDVDDIILNVFGGFLGFLIYVMIDKIYSKLPKCFKTKIFLNTFSIILLITVILGIFMIMM